MAQSSVNIQGALRKLKIAGDQAPFALVLALNALAQDGKEAAEEEARKVFDRPTSFTQRGFAIIRASKALPVSRVLIKDIQANYLRIQVTGGERRPKPGDPIRPPVRIRTNIYGNIPRGRIRTLLRKPDVFAVGASGGRDGHLPPGIYQRRRRGARRGAAANQARLSLLVALAREADYEKRFDFPRSVVDRVKMMAGRRLREGIERALATARKR